MTTLTKIAELKQSYDDLFSSGESNIVNICNIGRDLANQGFKEEADKCFDLAVKCMLLLLNSSKINMALHVEALIFWVVSAEKHPTLKASFTMVVEKPPSTSTEFA